MRSDAAADYSGLVHEAGFYGSDEELLDIVVPFLIEGVETGETTLAVFPAPTIGLVRDALADSPAVMVLDAEDRYLRPASTIGAYGELVDQLLVDGARRIRVAGVMPSSNLGAGWNGWARYEAAVNHLFADFPMWGLCMYDARTTPCEVLADVSKTHPSIATAGGGHVTNAHYQDPARFLEDRLGSRAQPADRGELVIELADPKPSAARLAVRGAALACGLRYSEVDDLVSAAQEAVVNALVHGLPPVRLRVWVGLRRTVVTITDSGPGPSDPFAGLRPPTEPDRGGRGLWQIHQLCEQVTMSRDENGFTIRLTTGRP